MKIVHRIDTNGIFLENVVLQDDEMVPADCVEVPMPDGIFLPAKFENSIWSTTLTQDEINAKLNPVVEPSELDNVKKQMADLSFQLMLNGVI